MNRDRYQSTIELMAYDDGYQQGRAEAIIRGNIEMLNGAKMLFKLSMSEKPNRTINECEAMIIFRNLEKQIKEQKNDSTN